MIYYFTVNTIIELICFITALVCLLNDNSRIWRSMIVFLFITCVTEMAGIYVKKLYLADRQHVHPNLWLYNILLIFQVGFFSLMFYTLLRKYINSKPIIISGLALIIVLYNYELFSHGIFLYNELTNTVLLVLCVLYSLFYFFLLLKDERYIQLKKSAEFWWVAGILFFYFGTTACNLFFDKLHAVVFTSGHYLTYYIYAMLNIILYSCWSYSFICRKWLIKTSQV